MRLKRSILKNKISAIEIFYFDRKLTKRDIYAGVFQARTG